jgi:hypothetical protein
MPNGIRLREGSFFRERNRARDWEPWSNGTGDGPKDCQGIVLLKCRVHIFAFGQAANPFHNRPKRANAIL